jgi:riboflavin synthase alpha subunit
LLGACEARFGIVRHVDAVGRVRAVETEGEGKRAWFDAPREVLRYCVEKGSIAVDGTSLTVGALDDAGFAVALVPHTLAATTLGSLTAWRRGQPRGRPGGEVRRTTPRLNIIRR